MISGFKEGVRLLNVGDEATLFLPYDIAYGEQGGRGIPAKANLIFEVKIVELLNKTPAAENRPPSWWFFFDSIERNMILKKYTLKKKGKQNFHKIIRSLVGHIKRFMKIRIFLLCFAFCLSGYCQDYFPSNTGVKSSKNNYHAIVNATLHVTPNSTIQRELTLQRWKNHRSRQQHKTTKEYRNS